MIPYVVLDLLFGLMWWLRDINIVDEHVITALRGNLIAAGAGPGAAPGGADGISVSAQNSLFLGFEGAEGTCGWASLRDSYSGRLQASALRLGCGRSKLRPKP